MKIKNLLLGLSATALSLSPAIILSSCQNKEIVYASIEVTSERDTVSVTDTLKMDIAVSPTTSDKPKVNWSVDDTSCGYIDNSSGILTAFKVGKIVVTATLESNPKVKASKTINIVDYLITPNITCAGGISAKADVFAWGDNLTIKYLFNQSNIDIDSTQIKLNGKILTNSNYFRVDEENQTLTINSYALSAPTPFVSIELTTTPSDKILPVVNETTGLSKYTVNNLVGGQQAVINYELESDYGIATTSDISAEITYSDSSKQTVNATKIDKKNKTITIAIPAADDVAVSGVNITITTCTLWDTEDAISYIYNRTFSISTTYDFGTMWIINPYDSNNLSSYEYYIATNWHVKYQLISSGADFTIGNGKDTEVSNYQTIRVVDWCDDEKMTYDGTAANAVDLAVAHVDLSNAAAKDKTIKTQLDNLNTYYQKHGYITQIADSTTSSKHYESLPLYTAGFPLQADGTPKWETHSFESNKLEYCGWDNTHSHGWEIGKSQFASDVSPMYGLIDECEYSVMAGGSSGSMLIGNFGTDEHPYFKVVAIYFGAWSSSPEPTANKHISFSIFNNDKKNFLKDYLN